MYRFVANLASKARVARTNTQQIGGRLNWSRSYAAKDIRFGVEARAAMLQGIEELADAVKLTMGPKVVTEELGLSIENMNFEMLGTCKKVAVSKDDTVILDGAGEKKSIEERCEQIRSTIELSTSDYDKEKLQERLAKISGGVAVLKIGGASEAEVGEKKDRVTDALNATKAAVEEGIVPGGGITLLYVAKELDKLTTTNFDQKIGVQIIQNALKERYQEILREKSQSQSDIDQCEAYYEAAGGTRKRRIYGLGSQAQSYYGPNLCVNFAFNASASAAPSTSQSAPTENMEELVMRLIPTLTDRLLPLFIEKARGVISSPSHHPDTPVDKPSVVTPIVPPPTTANVDDVDPLVSDDDRSPSPMH